MIAYLSGILIDIREQSVIINVDGVGYEVFTPSHARTLLSTGMSLELWIDTIMRETSLELFGFTEKDEYTLFKKLITVSGVGPRTALGVLESAPLSHIVQAIQDNDASPLTKISGIGKKTAEKIVIELRDKLQNFVYDTPSSQHRMQTEQLREALLAMGYSATQVRESLLHTTTDSDADISVRIKEALKFLSQ
jgi:Holliday junction DNA helicase RuvA